MKKYIILTLSILLLAACSPVKDKTEETNSENSEKSSSISTAKDTSESSNSVSGEDSEGMDEAGNEVDSLPLPAPTPEERGMSETQVTPTEAPVAPAPEDRSPSHPTGEQDLDPR